MLFDDEEQLEVRHVISLAHHDVSIYSGGDSTPEGELYIKRNAIRLARTAHNSEPSPDTHMSKPFYLFSENCSDKEDFYFALLRNQQQVFGAASKAPQPQQFEVRDIISLVQKLHASEEHMQTRWLNALLGRVFLGIYRTRDLENMIREKLTKKISRVKRPSFLSRIAIQDIDTGNSAPIITNPRLRDLNVEGEFVMEADVKYTGCFRLGVAATARIELGQRFKAREVNLLLAAVLKKLEGHILFKIKPPPSNRIWMSFQTMPKMEMTIEPIVSSRQITYTVILRQIENRIKEVLAETLVHPFWDDIPFFKTEHKEWRGGIFAGDDAVEHSEDYEEIVAALGDVDEVAHLEESGNSSPSAVPEIPMVEKSHTMPLDTSQPNVFWGRKANARKQGLSSAQPNSASTTALELKNSQPTASEKPPPVMRTGSFSASSPSIVTDTVHAETFKATAAPSESEDAASAMAQVAARASQEPLLETPIDPLRRMSSATDKSSNSSHEALPTALGTDQSPGAPPRRNTASSMDSAGSGREPAAPSPVPSTRSSVKSAGGSTGKDFFGRKEDSSTDLANGSTDLKRTSTLAAVSNAAATAKRWGLNALQRQNGPGPDGRKLSDPPSVDLNQPMGRGQPLPPPGTPLPGPDRRSKVTAIPVPPKKTLAPPNLPARQSSTSVDQAAKPERRPVPLPPLPRRRRVSDHHADEGQEEHVLVVEAPADSQPSTPLHEEYEHETLAAPKPAWVEDAEDSAGDQPTPVKKGPPELPRRPEVSHWASNSRMEGNDDYANWLDSPGSKEQEDGTKAREHGR